MQATEIRMTGALGSDSLAPWIEHRARKLNLQGWLEQSSGHTARIVVTGEPSMIEAMAVSCSLGPADVLVQDISTYALTLDRAVQGFITR